MRLRGVRSWLCGSFAALIVAIATQASAQGVTRIQQSDGSVQLYHDVRMSLKGETLWIRTADHEGVLEIVNGACSFTGDLQRCLPSAVTLHQSGRTHSITIDRGTVYLNLTDTAQRLHYSSRMLPPHNVLVEMHTIHGTFVSVQGTLDEVG